MNLPNKGDRLFLSHKEVIVIKVHTIFRLVKVHYTEETSEFIVDANALTTAPDYANSILLGMLRRK